MDDAAIPQNHLSALRNTEFDVVIIGGGPAGSANAALLAQAGKNVLVAEKSLTPTEKVCGGFICPQAFEILERIGVRKEVEAHAHGEINGFILAAPGGSRIEARFPRFRGLYGHRKNGISMHRSQFDDLLLKNAEKQGATVWRGARLVSLRIEDHEVRLFVKMHGEKEPIGITAQIVIGADGRTSTVARCAGLALPAAGTPRGVVHGHFEGVTSGGDKGEMHILSGGAYVALNFMSDGLCNFSYVADAEKLRNLRKEKDAVIRKAISSSPHLTKMFAGARLREPLRLLMPLRVSVKNPCGDRIMLVGDAGGFFDPLTGEGIFQALLTGQMAAEVAIEALDAGDCSERMLSRYGRMRARWTRPKKLLWQLFQGLIRRENLVNRFAAFLAKNPGMANLLIGFTGNYISPSVLLRPSILMKLLRFFLPLQKKRLLPQDESTNP